jgi:hypothetical protein
MILNVGRVDATGQLLQVRFVLGLRSVLDATRRCSDGLLVVWKNTRIHVSSIHMIHVRVFLRVSSKQPHDQPLHVSISVAQPTLSARFKVECPPMMVG